jgi:hypothetical protein
MLFTPRIHINGLNLLAAACLVCASASSARAETSGHGDMAAETAAPPSTGASLLAKVQGLIGTWDAQTHDGVLTDVFKPFALGTAVLGEEWINGKQITSTVFYVVNGELRADHYCDYKNQPRYTAVPSPDPAVLDFEFREATNLDTHPMHFHATQWRRVDSAHLTQSWTILGGTKPVAVIHMDFTKRPDGAPAPQPTNPAKG